MKNKSYEKSRKVYEMLGMARFQGSGLGRKLVEVQPVRGCRTWYRKPGDAEVCCVSMFGVWSSLSAWEREEQVCDLYLSVLDSMPSGELLLSLKCVFILIQNM